MHYMYLCITGDLIKGVKGKYSLLSPLIRQQNVRVPYTYQVTK